MFNNNNSVKSLNHLKSALRNPHNTTQLQPMHRRFWRAHKKIMIRFLRRLVAVLSAVDETTCELIALPLLAFGSGSDRCGSPISITLL